MEMRNFRFAAPGMPNRMNRNWPARYGRTVPDSGTRRIRTTRGAILSMDCILKGSQGLNSLKSWITMV
jgi:hypothetical protein